MTEPRKRLAGTHCRPLASALLIFVTLCFGSQVPSTPSDVTNDQEAALVEWGREPLKIAICFSQPTLP